MNRREVKKAPVLRFKGFTNDWEQRKFENLVSRLSKTSNNESLPNVTYDDIKSRENSLNKDITELTHGKKGIHFNKDDILFGKLRPYLGNILLARFNGIAVGDFWVLSPKDNNISSFLFDLIQTSKYKYISNLSSGSKMPRSDWNLVSKASFWVPIQQEQNKIGKIFQLIDNLVSLQQRKLSLIKTLKRSFLSDLFFKTSTNSIVITLKQVTSIRGGYAFKSKEFTENGYPIIKIANISNNGEIKGPYSYTNNFNKKYILTKNDIVLAMSGATTGKIAKLRSSKSFLQNQRIGYFCKTNNIDYNYLYYLLISDQFKKQLKRITIAGAQPNVSSLDIENFRFSVLSSKNKQKKISDFLNKLDIKIRITNKKITIFSQLKRSLLNNMFI